MVCLKAFQASFDLPLCNLFGAAINFCHQKHLLAIAIFQGIPHPDFTLALVVIPTVIHERDATIDGGANQPNALVVGEALVTDVEPAHPNGRDLLARASERSVKHLALFGSWR